MNRLGILLSICANRLRIVPRPRFVTYLVTWKCNGRCVFCDIWKKRSRDTENELSVDDVEKIFLQMPRLDVVRLSGGEPFLRADLAAIMNTIDKCSNPGTIHLTTNGLLTKRIIESLSTVSNPDKVHIKVSIDAIGERNDELRGIKGHFDCAMATVRELVRLREKTHLHVGVNQAIASEDDIPFYHELQNRLSPLKVPIYPCIANDSTNSLYSDLPPVDPASSVRPFGSFSNRGLANFMRTVLDDSARMQNYKERLVDRYHLRGLANRLLYGKSHPNPPCVALRSHLRILPDGSVPVCLFNSEIIGNLRNETVRTIWQSEKANALRKWTRSCKGCWQSCESAVSAIYSGDIFREVFHVGSKKFISLSEYE